MGKKLETTLRLAGDLASSLASNSKNFYTCQTTKTLREFKETNIANMPFSIADGDISALIEEWDELEETVLSGEPVIEQPVEYRRVLSLQADETLSLIQGCDFGSYIIGLTLPYVKKIVCAPSDRFLRERVCVAAQLLRLFAQHPNLDDTSLYCLKILSAFIATEEKRAMA